MMIDPGPIVGFFFEGSYTKHFGDRSEVIEAGAWEQKKPEPPIGTASLYTAAVLGGVQFRL